MIPYSRQCISDEDIDAVVAVLKSDFLTQGELVPAFERAIAEYVGARYAVAVNSGTSALHIACLALGLGYGDRLWTSPISFVASANCGLYCGAEVEFVDVDPGRPWMSVDALDAKLEAAEKSGCLPKVVVPVHYAGESCDAAAIRALAQKYGFYVVEDACHALGGDYRDTKIGSCRYCDVAVFSFHPLKSITTGEGGVAVTNNADLAGKMKLLSSHAITRDKAVMTKAPEGLWYYQQLALGFNYRMTDVQAGLGLSQLKRLDTFMRKRRNVALRYDELLQRLAVRPLPHQADCRSAHHLYPVCLRLDEIRESRSQVFQSMRDSGIGVNVHYIPIYAQPYYRAAGHSQVDCPNAERYYAETMSIPIYPELEEEQQDKVAVALGQAIREK